MGVDNTIAKLKEYFDKWHKNSHKIDTDLVYPVGSIYMSVNDTNPATIFGGTWEKIEGRFLLGTSIDYPLGEKKGEKQHTLTTNEMPSHNHSDSGHNHTQSNHTHTLPYNYHFLGVRNVYDNGAPILWNLNYYVDLTKLETNTPSKARQLIVAGNTDGFLVYEPTDTTSQTPSIYNSYANISRTGEGQAHNNMPPYIAVNIWKRVN